MADSAWNLFTPDMMDPKKLMAMNQPKVLATPDQLAERAKALQDAQDISIPKAEDLAAPKAPPPSPPPQIVSSPRPPMPGAVPLTDEGQLTQLIGSGLGDRAKRTDEISSQLHGLGDRPTGLDSVDLSPLLAWSDSINGTNTAQSYKGPGAANKWDAQHKLLSDALDRNQDKISDDRLAYLKTVADENNKEKMADVKLQAAQLLAATRGGNQDVKDDNLGNKVSDAFDKNPLLNNYSATLGKLATDAHTLDHPPKGGVSGPMLKEITNGIAMALSGAGASSQDDRQKQEYSNLATQWAAVASKFQDAPEGIASPELIQYVRDSISRLQQATAQNAERRSQNIAGGRHYHSGQATQILGDKTKQYSAKSLLDQAAKDASVGESAPLSADDQKAVSWAKANPNDPDAIQILKLHGM